MHSVRVKTEMNLFEGFLDCSKYVFFFTHTMLPKLHLPYAYHI